MKSFLFQFILLFFSISFFAQQSKIDSLKNCIEQAENDTVRVNELNELSRFYIYYLPQNAPEYANKAIQIASKINFKIGRAYGYLNLGYHSFRIDNYNASIKWYNKAHELFISDNHLIGQGLCFQLKAKSLNGLGDYEVSMEYLIKSIKCFNDANFPKGIGKVYEIMGGINDIFGDYDLALENLNRSINMKYEFSDLEDISRPYAYLGNVYIHLDSIEKAEENYNLALELSRKNYNLNTESYTQTRLGDLFFKSEKYDQSIASFKRSLKITNIQLNQWGDVRNLQGIGKGLYKMGNYQESIVFLNKAVKIANGINDKVGLKNSYEYLYMIYDQYDSIEPAFHFYKLYNLYKDSLFNKKVVSNISLSQIRYKSEQDKLLLKKEQEKKNIIALKEKEKSDLIIYFGTALIITMICFIVLMFYQLFNTKRKKAKIEVQKLLVEEKNQEITDSISYAQKIQEALLTSDNYIKKCFPDSFVYYQPKDLVSGDFYWMYSNDEYVFFTVFDCTGHGVPGAFMSMIGSSLLNEMIIERNMLETNEIMDVISNKIKQSLGQNNKEGESRDGMDMVLCRLNKKTNELMFTCAKNPLWVIRDGQLVEYKGDKRPVGYFIGKGIPFTSQKIILNNNDIVYLFSDGFADQFGGKQRKKYKSHNFKNYLLSISENNLDIQFEKLFEEFNNWKGEYDQLDDVCVIGLRI